MVEINGVVVKKLTKYSDDRGFLMEIFRKDEDIFIPAMSYISHTKFGVSRGPHEHKDQADFFCFTGPGDFDLYLWDNRKDSSTYKEKIVLRVGESSPCSVIVPAGVVHGYKAISEEGSFSINLPDKLFMGKDKTEEIDEIRHENDENSEFKIE